MILTAESIECGTDWFDAYAGGFARCKKWKLTGEHERGLIIQRIQFSFEVYDYGDPHGDPLTFAKIDEKVLGASNLNTWHTYCEAWVVKKNEKIPSLNKDTFYFAGFLPALEKSTRGSLRERGEARFYETALTLNALGFKKNKESPAGQYLHSSLSFPVGLLEDVRTSNPVIHTVDVTWDTETPGSPKEWGPSEVGEKLVNGSELPSGSRRSSRKQQHPQRALPPGTPGTFKLSFGMGMPTETGE